ncbi:MAG: isoprenylcysteine carboxylmethyltransferase family protein [Syntrophobacteraceae bacterium]|jgi:protein-S-isoprenylcysteine O-methyltransferase Ste14
MNTKAKALLLQIITFPVMALVLFVPAGTGAWFAGWVYLVLFAAFSITVTLWLLRHNPGLIEERMGFKPNQKTWDKMFMVALYVVFLVWLVLMPLDAVRFHWSRMAAWLQMVGAVVLLFSFYVFYLTFRENPYLSAAVRIQEDRGQTVVSTGPYRHVRHPMYTGGFLYFLGTALLLGSWYGVFFEPIFAGMIAVRAVLEERLLREQLKGYDAYMAQVKYRFIPHVW